MALTACPWRRLAIALLLSVALTSPVNAVLLGPGDAVTLNFNFTGEMPSPPYNRVFVQGAFGAFSPDAIANISLFGQLNGAGTLFDHFTLVPFSAFVLQNDTDAEILDGVFSVVIKDLSGIFDFIAASAAGDASGGSALIEPEVVVQRATEPSTLALLGIVFAGLGLARRGCRS